MTKRLDRSVVQTEVQIFDAAIKSPVTRDVYERRLLNFLKHLRMTPEELVSLAKNDPLGVEKKIIAFAFELKKRHERAEIAAGTVHNCVKCIRLLLASFITSPRTNNNQICNLSDKQMNISLLFQPQGIIIAVPASGDYLCYQGKNKKHIKPLPKNSNGFGKKY